MSSNKKAKSKFSFIIICIIGFVVSIFFEFYFISYFPYDYFMLFGTGIIMCIFGYLSIDGVLEIINQTSRKRDEQNEIMIKASKAIYLTTKKIALNSSHSISDTLETPKDISSLIDDLSQANERLAREVENAVSLQSLVQKNRTIVNNAREIIEDHEQPLSPLEVEKDLKLDEAISETDFETVTQPETIDSMIRQEVAVQEASSASTQKEYETGTPMNTDILEETIEAVGNIMKETSEETEQASDLMSDIFSEVKETASHILNNSAENSVAVENGITIEDSATGQNGVTTVENSVAAQNSVTTAENSAAAQNNRTAVENNEPVESNEIAENSNPAENSKTAENTTITENNEATTSTIITENDEAANSAIAAKDSEMSKSDVVTENSKSANTVNTVSEPEMPSTQETLAADSSKTSTSHATDKPLTSEEIASLFANL